MILPLVAFQKGVVYLSPKTRQIRMEFHDPKHLKFASEAVKTDAIKTRWQSVDHGSYFKLLRGLDLQQELANEIDLQIVQCCVSI